MQADVRATLEERGMKVIASTPEELASLVKSDIARLGKLIREAGIRE